jgi:hypothetical protein
MKPLWTPLFAAACSYEPTGPYFDCMFERVAADPGEAQEVAAAVPGLFTGEPIPLSPPTTSVPIDSVTLSSSLPTQADKGLPSGRNCPSQPVLQSDVDISLSLSLAGQSMAFVLPGLVELAAAGDREPRAAWFIWAPAPLSGDLETILTAEVQERREDVQAIDWLISGIGDGEHLSVGIAAEVVTSDGVSTGTIAEGNFGGRPASFFWHELATLQD